MDTKHGRLRQLQPHENEGGDGPSEGARKRAAIELIRNEERTLRRTARRYSFCEDDAEDAYQRALEILLTKAPTTEQRQLIKWTQTVTKHEALAVRKQRERILAHPAQITEDGPDWLDLVPSSHDGPADLAERREAIARCREALQTLKPHELRALTLLAQGYSYRTRSVPWTTFAPLKADSTGRIHFEYAFSDPQSRGVRFEFRALATRETGWPYGPAPSPSVVVTGR